jgi:hypothetical protein
MAFSPFNIVPTARQVSIFANQPDSVINSYSGLKKRFLGGPLPDATPPNSVDARPDSEKYYDELSNLATQRPLMSAYQKQILSPLPKDEPSVKRRVGAGVLGGLMGYATNNAVSGAETAAGFAHKPYQEAMQKRNLGIDQLGKASSIEDKALQDRIDALKEARNFGLKYSEYELKQLVQQQKDKIDQANLELNAVRTGAYTSDLGNQGRNRDAGTTLRGREVAATEGRLANDQKNTASLIGYRLAMQAIGQKNADANLKRADGTPATPEQKGAAIDNALLLLKMRPENGAFFDSTTGKIKAPSTPTRAYQVFLQEFARLTQAELSKVSNAAPDQFSVTYPNSDIEFLDGNP